MSTDVTDLDQAAVDYITGHARELLDQTATINDDTEVWAERGSLRWAVRRLLDIVDGEPRP